MIVKNISKKIIGNQSFRLLPGECMEVEGKELWVKDYIAEKKLETVTGVAGQMPELTVAADIPGAVTEEAAEAADEEVVEEVAEDAAEKNTEAGQKKSARTKKAAAK